MREMNLVNNLNEVKMKSMRDGWGEGLVDVGEKNNQVVVLTGDLGESTRVSEFGKKWPERLIQVGVAEQNLMGVAAGMALEGKIPFVSSFAVFSPGRNWDQLRVSVAYTNANVKIVGSHVGVSVGVDGASHQALEDIAITRVLPGLKVVAPADFEQAKKMVGELVRVDGPVYMRVNRNKTGVFTTEATPLVLGKAQVLREGSEVTIVACGAMVYEALMVAEELKGKVEVINMHMIKPLDKETLVRSIKKTGRVVVVEEHQVIGGLAGAVAETLMEVEPVLMRRIGMNDCFGESGEAGELLEKYGMTRGDIMGAVKELMEIKK